jgi:hypothetical protein
MSKRILVTAAILFLIITGNINSKPRVQLVTNNNYYASPNVIQQQIRFDANNMDTWVHNTGIFDQDIRTSNTPGLMWPKGSNRFAIFTAGLCIGSYIEGQLKLATASYKGEYAPGYVQLVGGVPTPITNADFRLYKVTSDDSNSVDYLNWYKMVPYGAPYVDRNNNGQWDIGIDRPGIKNATQTIFVCMTDGWPENHTASEGFSGGTAPIFSEMRLTAWAYGETNTPEPLKDVQFISYVVINKNNKAWNNTFFGLVSDPDLGDAADDYIGCDTTLNLGYCYNSDNNDGNGNPPSYGANPPAVGMDYLLSPIVPTGNQNDTVVFYNPPGSNNRIVKKGFKELGMSSFVYFSNFGTAPECETDPTQPIEAYRYLNGIRRDALPWFHPSTKQRVKKLYTGNPETLQGWTELGYNGNPNMARINNCNLNDSITTYSSPPGDRRIIFNSGNENYTVNPGDTQRVMIAQLVARGTSNVNSVTKLKNLSITAQIFANQNFTVGVMNISTEVPSTYSLSQNYPNPFNSSSNLKFQIVKSGQVKLVVYDIQGREVQTLVNERLQPGTYEASFDGSALNSGVYFYRLSTGDFTESKKMLLIK